MLIHLTASTRNLDENIPYLKKITQLCYETGAVLAYDWIKPYLAVRDKIKHSDIDWAMVHEANLDAINRADIVIVEATAFSFNQGYQTGLAIQSKKPTLVISRQPFTGKTTSRYKSKYLTVKQYNDMTELETIVSKFVKSNIIATKDLRFNLFIDRRTHNYLRDASFESGRNKSEIIRELLLREIELEDS